MSASAIDFLRSHGMDFQRWMYRGVPYLDRAGEAAFHEQRAADRKAALDPTQLADKLAALTESERAWVTGSSDIARQLAATPAALRGATSPEWPLASVQSAAACSALRAVVEADDQLRREIEVLVKGRHSSKDASLRRRPGGEYEAAERRVVTDKVGFKTVFDALSKSGKPVVAHNSFADLQFLHSAFVGPLPTEVGDFAASIKDVFRGGIYDTKYLCSFTPTALVPHGRFESTSLGGLFNAYGPATDLVSLSFPEGFHAYDPEAMRNRRGGGSSGAHEAGYDALMTGVVFANATREFAGLEAAGKDKIAVFGSLHGLDVDPAAASVSTPVTRGDILDVAHPWGDSVGTLVQSLPAAHQMVMPVASGRALVCLEPTPAATYTPQVVTIPGLSGRPPRAPKPFMSGAACLDAIAKEAAAKPSGPLSRVAAKVFDASSVVKGAVRAVL